MLEHFKRTEMLIGKHGLDKLSNSCVAVFGIGGVGSFVVESLARSGIGKLVLIDNDNIDITNINRQIHANVNTIGKSKVKCMKERILQINPNLDVVIYQEYYDKSKTNLLISNSYDYVVDAIDSVTSKLDLIEECTKKGIPLISSMGAGNKLDPTKFEISDISKTSVCPLAKVIRKELRNRGINKLKVVYSKEEPIKTGASTPGSIAFIPSVVGLILSSEVINDLIK